MVPLVDDIAKVNNIDGHYYDFTINVDLGDSKAIDYEIGLLIDDEFTTSLPETVKIIPMKCFEECYELTNITIPLNETRVIYGNKIFNNQPHFNQSIYLPNSIKVINGNRTIDEIYEEIKGIVLKEL